VSHECRGCGATTSGPYRCARCGEARMKDVWFERCTRVRDALRDSCAGCARGDAFEGDGIHTNDSVGRTLCALTPRQLEALKP
jgi:hypothetical protein